MKFQVVKIKSGYAVQNTQTYAIAWAGKSEVKAIEIANNLNSAK